MSENRSQTKHFVVFCSCIGGYRVFASDARHGKTSMGWFFGYKLHLAAGEQFPCSPVD
jgi:Transposase DDE domain